MSCCPYSASVFIYVFSVFSVSLSGYSEKSSLLPVPPAYAIKTPEVFWSSDAAAAVSWPTYNRPEDLADKVNRAFSG